MFAFRPHEQYPVTFYFQVATEDAAEPAVVVTATFSEANPFGRMFLSPTVDCTI